MLSSISEHGKASCPLLPFAKMPRQLRLLALLAAVHVCTPFCAPPARARSSPPRRAAVEDDDPELAPPSLSAADRELFDLALQLSGSAPSDEGPSFWSEDELADEAAGDDDAARGATADGAGGDAAAAAGAAFGDLALSPRLAAGSGLCATQACRQSGLRNAVEHGSYDRAHHSLDSNSR